MHPCPECGSHVHRSDRSCPHCGTRIGTAGARSTAAAALLGLTMACSGKEPTTTDTGDTDTTTAEPAYGVTITEPEYGVTITTPTSTGDTGTYTSGSGSTGGVDYGAPYTYGGSGS